VERAHCDFTPQKSTFDHQIERRKTMKNTPMAPEERVEAFKRELGLMLGQILGLDPEAQKQLPQDAQKTAHPEADEKTV
jgi:hypothetical protein